MRHVIAAAATAIALAAPPAAAQEIVEVETDRSVAEAADALVAAVEGAGARVVARVDHQANAAGAGMELRPITKVIFGNPAIGTPIMQADPRAGLLLPQMVLIWEDAEGRVRLGYLEPGAAFADLDVPDEALEPVRGALERLTAAAAGG